MTWYWSEGSMMYGVLGGGFWLYRLSLLALLPLLALAYLELEFR